MNRADEKVRPHLPAGGINLAGWRNNVRNTSCVMSSAASGELVILQTYR